MLLRLAPDSPTVPTVHFTIALRDPSEHVPVPVAWQTQLHRLHFDQLDLPSDIHGLDKATWLTAVLHSVTFSLEERTVQCVFIDGWIEQWPLDQLSCVQCLRGVLHDVELSAVAGEHEKRKFELPRPAPSPPPSAKPTKHKKQRSLLMSLAATLGFTQSLSASPAPPPPPPPPSVPELPGDMSSHALRRRARSSLVNTFRRYVLSELSVRIRRTAPFDFWSWIVASSIRRTAEQLADIAQSHQHDEDPFGPSSVPTAIEGLEEEDGTVSTDTDGSSVHTPLEAPGHQSQPPKQNLPRSPSPPSPPPRHTLTQQQHENRQQTESLHARLSHLRALLHHASAQQSQIDAEQDHLHAVLEIKSRRRAWSNRDYRGGALVSDIGFGIPVRGSPLVRYGVVCAGDMTSERDLVGLEVCTREESVSVLFPPSEDDDDEDDDEEDDTAVFFNRAFDGETEMESLSSIRLVAPHAHAHSLGVNPEDDMHMDIAMNMDVDLAGDDEEAMLHDAAESGLLLPFQRLEIHPRSLHSRHSPSHARAFGDSVSHDRAKVCPPVLSLSSALGGKRTSPPMLCRSLPAPAPAGMPPGLGHSASPSPVPTPVTTPTSTVHTFESQHRMSVFESRARSRSLTEFEPRTKIGVFDACADDELFEEDQCGAGVANTTLLDIDVTQGEMDGQDEFTLAMDLPPPYHSNGRRRHGAHVLGAKAGEHDNGKYGRGNWAVGVSVEDEEVGVMRCR